MRDKFWATHTAPFPTGSVNRDDSSAFDVERKIPAFLVTGGGMSRRVDTNPETGDGGRQVLKCDHLWLFIRTKSAGKLPERLSP